MSLPSVRTLLLVDDEVSTGTTLFNLAAALMPALPRCERILVATLTDWTGSAGWLRRMPRDAECVTLLSGRLRWRGAEGELTAPPACPEAQALGTLSSPGSFGRVGIAAGSAIPAFDAKLLALPPQSQIRLVGTGEFTYPPFLLGEQLERAGHDVLVQATSRSPVRTGGIVACGLKFDDNYGSGAPNFLYNAGPSGGRLSFVCHETAPGTLDPQLLKALDARALYFGAD